MSTPTTRNRPTFTQKKLPLGNDVWRIVRLHNVNLMGMYATAGIIIFVATVITALIALILFSRGLPLNGMRSSWSVLAPIWFLFPSAVLTLSASLTFSLGVGSTRRAFWLGTMLHFVMFAVAIGVFVATMAQLEIATNGWGLGMHMFNALWFGTEGWFVDAFSFATLCFTILSFTAAVTTIFMRWRMVGLIVLGSSIAVTALILVALQATWFIDWFWWLVRQSTVTKCLWALGVAAVAAVVGFLIVRRISPR